ncbi:MAG: S8 family serine peptidase [Gemmatimonadota bacterium]
MPPIVLTDQLIVRFRSAVTEEEIFSLIDSHGADELEHNPFDDRIRLLRVGTDSTGDVIDLVASFHQSPLIEWVYPDWASGSRSEAWPPDDPDDPHFGSQWHLKNGSGGVGDIGVMEAWEITTGDEKIVIAVIEPDGFEITHPDLEKKLWENSLEADAEAAGITGFDEDGNGLTDDIHGWNFFPCFNTSLSCWNTDLSSGDIHHGTAVAGLIGAETDNGKGVAGVCPECRLMLLRTGPKQWGRLSAILYASEMEASVINASWSMAPYSPLSWAIKSVARGGREGRGIPIVFAAGNVDEDVCQGDYCTLGSLREVITVSSSTIEDKKIEGAGFGSCLDLLAPGGVDQSHWGITTTDQLQDAGYNNTLSSCPTSVSELPDRDYSACFGGTSAAAPIVSGVVGLMLSINPTLTREMVRDILIKTAKKVDCAAAEYGGITTCPTDAYARSDHYGYGRVDASKAVKAAKETLVPIVVTAGGSLSVTWPKFEAGARAGWTNIRDGSGGQDASIGNGPGGGPEGAPVFHFTWFSGGSGVGPPNRMLELQLGSTVTSFSNPSGEESHTVVALQAAYILNPIGPSVYIGLNGAYQRRKSINSPATTDGGLGFGIGYRFTPLPYLALRAEGRYRRWNSSGSDEIGVSVGFGVLF